MTMESPLLASYPPLPLDLERAEGCELIARDGKRYLDLYGGHCVCLLGHNPPGLRAALAAQMDRITFYSTALALPERDEAARALLRLAPDGFGRVFFVNSGTEANENALKFACAFTGRTVIVAIEGAFHGRTAAADAVTGDAARKIHYPRAPFDVRWVPFGDTPALERALASRDAAAVILEPVQSMAGCRVHAPAFIDALNALSKETGTLVIADEVQGGLWRCGAAWSHQAIGLRADLITCAKGLGAGFPVGALISREMHGTPGTNLFGSTFGGGPLAVAAARHVCDTVSKPSFHKHVRLVSQIFDRCEAVAGVGAVYGRGLLRGVRVGPGAGEIKSKLFARGFIVGSSNDKEVLRLMPPLTLSEAQAQAFVAALGDALAGR